MNGQITPIATTLPHVFAFRLSGEISQEDLDGMARTMLSAFDTHDRINMLLVFDGYEGSSTFSALQTNVLKAQMQALANVERYAVVGAPAFAESMIAASDAIMPIEAKAFDRNELTQAWEFVGAQPADGHAG